MASPWRAATAQALSPDPAATRSQPTGSCGGCESRSRHEQVEEQHRRPGRRRARPGAGAGPTEPQAAPSAQSRWLFTHRARRQMGGSPDAARRLRTPSVTASARTTQEAGHDHAAHRDAHHRRRPGRARDGVPAATAGPSLPGRRPQRADRRQLASAVGHPQALQPRQVRRPPGPPVPGAAVVLPGQGGRRRLPGEVRDPRRPAGPDVHAGGSARGPARGRVHRVPRVRHHHLRQRRGGHRHLRTHAERAGLRRRARPRDPAAALQRVPPSRRSSATARCSWSAPRTPAATSPTRLAEHRPTTLVGPDRGQIPVQWNSRTIRLAFRVLTFMWQHVDDPPDTHRAQGDGRDPPPRRPHAAGQARRPPGPRRGSR